MPESRFDAWVAERYDLLWPELFDPTLVESTVDFLAGWAGSGPALELGVGTGRIAQPLSQRGIRVHGIELSRAMVEQLQTELPETTVSRSATLPRPQSTSSSRLCTCFATPSQT